MKIMYEKLKVRFPVLGLFVISLIVFPYVLLGEGSYVQVHDQMDGEILNYIYQAKYLFSGNVIPEFMNGASKAAMQMPAPFGVLFYLVFSPFWAYAVMHWFVLCIGFLGMYFLCRNFSIREEIALLAACLYCYIPFYPVYGLTQLGLPLLLLCAVKLLRGDSKLLPFLGIVLYGGFSSFALLGYAHIGIGVGTAIVFTCIKKKKAALDILAATFLLLMVYLLTNVELLQSVVGNGGFVSHRTEMVLQPEAGFFHAAMNRFWEGSPYGKTYPEGIFVGAILVLGIAAVSAVRKDKGVRVEYTGQIGGCLIILVIGAVLATLWRSEPIMTFRRHLDGFFAYFQADRITWIFPFLWMLLFSFALESIVTLLWKKERILRSAGIGIVSLVILGQFLLILRDNTLNQNVRLLFLKKYDAITWQGLYMPDVFAKIDAVIGETKGEGSVVSLGIYPSVALYNGYTCADGYSNNYDVVYKHMFREVIAEELEEDETVKIYFDEWGNRCYFVDAAYGFGALVGKGSGVVYEDLKFNREAMDRLQIKYIFSAAPIQNTDELGLILLEGSPFTSETAYYAVYCYRLIENP